ncbi:MAG: glycoside hydrolase family 65 protein [Nitrospirota bacterium]|nr:MAG: glycoside hydrolase family 65 protein [Nitrospirota bacterium]
MIHHERLKPDHHVYPPDEWNMIEKKFNPNFLAQTETMYAVGNGYLGMRGCSEEGGPTGQEGTFINGFYESWPIVYGEEAFGYAKTGQTIVNATDTKIIKLYVDDEPFWLPNANMLSYDRRLNMKAGILEREILWETPSGKQVLIKSKRLVSFQHRHLAAISYEVTVQNAQAPVVIASQMVTTHRENAEDDNDPRKAKAFKDKVLQPLMNVLQDRRVVLCHSTKNSKMMLGCGIDHTLKTECPYAYKGESSEEFGQIVFTIEAQPGRSIHLKKYMAYHTSHTASFEEMDDRVEQTLDRAVTSGFSSLQTGQQEYMDEFWRRSDIQVTGLSESRAKRSNVEIQQAIRFNLFHILQAAGRADTTGVAAKGLTGQAYEGQYFWDTEIYVMPFLIYTNPRMAKNLLTYRYRLLDKARARARELSINGAMFAWRTINGDEASAYYAAGTAQYHINADIMYALKKYVNATGDEEFLKDYGSEMLVETARLWADLGFFSERKGGKFCINGVTGPDEYNTVVDNNVFTNLMAQGNLRYAVKTMKWLREKDPAAFAILQNKTQLDLGEIEEWKTAADNMYIPVDERLGIHPQDESFLDKERWDFEKTLPEKYPLLLSFHPLTIYRHQVIKQADVVLAMFLHGENFSLEQKKRNFEFYDPLTTGDSSLSSCIQSIIALEIGDYEKSAYYARMALLMDLADVGGNVTDGCHIASMGGTWMALAYGFLGMRDYDGVFTFRPRRPKDSIGIMRVPLTMRETMILVEIDASARTATYSLQEGDGLMIRHEDEEIHLTKDDPTATRAIAEDS